MTEENTDKSTVPAESTEKTPRILWPSLQGRRGQGNRTSYPFLAPENLMDLALIRVILAERPYKSGYGKKQEGWEVCAKTLLDQKDGSGRPIFNVPVSWKTVQACFEK